MISPSNTPINNVVKDTDFTVDNYRKILSKALMQFGVADYGNIPWDERFLLWRHDCDCSMERALRLAEVEAQEGMQGTYFVNIHCEFYNILENSQSRIVEKICSLGHSLGVHFDAEFYKTASESQLDDQISTEARLLENFFGVKPAAFSFHQPSEFHLSCEAEYYGGLVNCYSERFKEQVPYVSDSNGYWRFRRLDDVLDQAQNRCLQVLTHPGWWQENPMPPRKRIFRSVYGRATAVMQKYDADMDRDGRQNFFGGSNYLQVFKSSQPQFFELCDYLWNREHFRILFMELWRQHEALVSYLCQAYLRNKWNVPDVEIESLFLNKTLSVPVWKLFELFSGGSWSKCADLPLEDYRHMTSTRNQMVNGVETVSSAELEEHCIRLCTVIRNIASWGEEQSIDYDGLSHLSSIRSQTKALTEKGTNAENDDVGNGAFSDTKWEDFKQSMSGPTDQ